MTFNKSVELNSIKPFDYEEELFDFIDKKYKTTYNDCDMNDEIERLSDSDKFKDFNIAEQIYNIACDKYPKIKKHQHLNP